MGSVCCVPGRGSNRPIVTWEEAAEAVLADLRRERLERLERKSELSPEIRNSEEDLEVNPQTLPLSREAESVAVQSEAHISGSSKDQIISLQMATYGGQTLSALPDTASSSYLSTSPPLRNSHLASASSTPSKWSPRVTRSHFFRQGSDSLLCGPRLATLTTEGTSSPKFAVSSIESTRRSYGGSHDGLSVLSIPEGTTSTHKRTWSFDRSSLGSHHFKMPQSRSSKSDSNSIELETCLLCSKYVKEYVVAAILACGHVYHADCLEHLTLDICKYDPPCPVCTLGEKGAMKMMGKLLKQNERTNAKMLEKLLNNGMDSKPKNKKHRNRVINSDFVSLVQLTPRFEPSTSSMAKPFLKRHFSFNSKASSSSSENNPVRNRSLLWSRSSK